MRAVTYSYRVKVCKSYKYLLSMETLHQDVQSMNLVLRPGLRTRLFEPRREGPCRATPWNDTHVKPYARNGRIMLSALSYKIQSGDFGTSLLSSQIRPSPLFNRILSAPTDLIHSKRTRAFKRPCGENLRKKEVPRRYLHLHPHPRLVSSTSKRLRTTSHG